MATRLRMAQVLGLLCHFGGGTDLNMRDGKPREHEALTLNERSTY